MCADALSRRGFCLVFIGAQCCFPEDACVITQGGMQTTRLNGEVNDLRGAVIAHWQMSYAVVIYAEATFSKTEYCILFVCILT